jgi:hypothetical protein
MENDPTKLRAQAALWRQTAFGYDKRTARALIEAARSLEDRAARIEAARGDDGNESE